MRKAAQAPSLHVAVWWILIYHITIHHEPNGAANHVQTKATAARADIRMEKLTVSWTAMRLHVLYMTRVLEGHRSSTIEDWCGFIGCQWSHINVTGCGLLFSFLDLFSSRSSIRRLRKKQFLETAAVYNFRICFPSVSHSPRLESTPRMQQAHLSRWFEKVNRNNYQRSATPCAAQPEAAVCSEQSDPMLRWKVTMFHHCVSRWWGLRITQQRCAPYTILYIDNIQVNLHSDMRNPVEMYGDFLSVSFCSHPISDESVQWQGSNHAELDPSVSSLSRTQSG